MATPQNTVSAAKLDQSLQNESQDRQGFASLKFEQWVNECPQHFHGALAYPGYGILTDTALLPVCSVCSQAEIRTPDGREPIHIDTCLCATDVHKAECGACKVSEMEQTKQAAVAANTRISQDGTSTLVCGCGNDVQGRLGPFEVEWMRRCACCGGFQSGNFLNWYGEDLVFRPVQDHVMLRGVTPQGAEISRRILLQNAPQQPGPPQQPPPPPPPTVPTSQPGSSLQNPVVTPDPAPLPPPPPPTAPLTVQQQRDAAHGFAQQAMAAGNTNTAYLQHPGAALPIATRKQYLLERRDAENRANPVNLESRHVHHSLEPLRDLQHRRSERVDQRDVVLTPQEYDNLLTSKRVYQIAQLQPTVQRFVSRVWGDAVRNDEVFAVLWMAIHYGGIKYTVP